MTTLSVASLPAHPVSDKDLAARLPGFSSQTADLQDVRLHYVEGGEGQPLVLLSGWPQTWWAYHKIMPILAQHYRVIAVDMRGQGSSQKTRGGYDKKTMAADIARLVGHLGFDKVFIAGHDIGAMVAYSFAANHIDRTAKLAMLDIPHPFEGFWQIPMLAKPTDHGLHHWWLPFNALKDLPGRLLEGRHKILFDWVFDYQMIVPGSISEFDREVFAAAYEVPGASAAVAGWYATFNQDIADLGSYPVLPMPVLGLGGITFPILEMFLNGRAGDLKLVALEECGHWLSEEKPSETAAALISFLG